MSRPQDIALVCLALASGALGFVAWRQQGEIRRLTQQLHDRAPLPASVISVHQATTRGLPVAPRRTEAAGWTGNTPDEFRHRVAPADAPAGSRRGDALARLMENPEFVELLGLQRHAMLDARFAALFRRLNLSEAELAAFKRLLVEKENVALDVVTVSETAPEGPLSPESLRAGIRAAQGQVEQAIHSSLGSERYAMYREYERTLAHRTTVAQLEQRLSYTGAPLSATQSEAMVRLMVAAAPVAQAENVPAMSVVVRAGVPEAVPVLPTNAGTGRVTDDVLVQAQTVLAPAQLTALREIQAEQLAATRAAALIRSAVPARSSLPAWIISPLLQ